MEALKARAGQGRWSVNLDGFFEYNGNNLFPALQSALMLDRIAWGADLGESYPPLHTRPRLCYAFQASPFFLNHISDQLGLILDQPGIQQQKGQN